MRYWLVWPLAALWTVGILTGIGLFVFTYGPAAGWGLGLSLIFWVAGLFLACPDFFECDRCKYRMGWIAYVCHRIVIRSGEFT